jgi:uncharacterized protein YprB with RNaseH-like and TPR domain
MAIFRTREAAEAFSKQDPFIREGLVKSFRHPRLERQHADLMSCRRRRLHLVTNLKTAKALGLTIPQSLLASRRGHPVSDD